MASLSTRPNLQKLIHDIQECINEMKRECSDSGAPIDDDNKTLQRFCTKLEYLLQYEQIDRSSFLGGRKDYWNYICEGLSSTKGVRDGLKYVKTLSELKTNLGRGRAFIRFALTYQHLADSLQQCVNDQRLTREWYTPSAVWLNADQCRFLISVLYDLNDVRFDLGAKGYDLDNSWPLFARHDIPTHKWNVALSRTSSIGSLNSAYNDSSLKMDPVPFVLPPAQMGGMSGNINLHDAVDAVGETREELLACELDQSELVRADLAMRVTELEGQLEIANNAKNAAVAQLNTTEERCNIFESRCTELENAATTASAEVAAQQIQLVQYQVLAADCEQLTKECEELRRTLVTETARHCKAEEDLRKEVQSLESRLALTDSSNAQLKLALEAAAEECRLCTGEREDAKRELERTTELVVNLQTVNTRLHAELRAAATANASTAQTSRSDPRLVAFNLSASVKELLRAEHAFDLPEVCVGLAARVADGVIAATVFGEASDSEALGAAAATEREAVEHAVKHFAERMRDDVESARIAAASALKLSDEALAAEIRRAAEERGLLQQALDELADRLQRTDDELACLQEAFQASARRLALAEDQRDSLQRELHESAKGSECLLSERNGMLRALEELNERLRYAETECDSMRRELEESLVKLKGVESDCLGSQEALRESHERLKCIEKERDDTQRALDASAAELLGVKAAHSDRIAIFVEENKGLSAECEHFRQRMEQLELECRAACPQLLLQKEGALADAAAAIAASEQGTESASNEKRSLREQLDALCATMNAKEAERVALHDAVESVAVQLDGARMEAQRLAAQVVSIRSKLEDSERALAAAELALASASAVQQEALAAHEAALTHERCSSAVALQEARRDHEAAVEQARISYENGLRERDAAHRASVEELEVALALANAAAAKNKAAHDDAVHAADSSIREARDALEATLRDTALAAQDSQAAHEVAVKELEAALAEAKLALRAAEAAYELARQQAEVVHQETKAALQAATTDHEETKGALGAAIGDCKKIKAALSAMMTDCEEAKAALQVAIKDHERTKAVLQAVMTDHEETKVALQAAVTDREETKAVLQVAMTDHEETKMALRAAVTDHEMTRAALQASMKALEETRDAHSVALQEITVAYHESKAALLEAGKANCETKAALQEAEAAHQDTKAALQETVAALLDSKAAVQSAKSTYEETNAALREAVSNLQETKANYEITLREAEAAHRKAFEDTAAAHDMALVASRANHVAALQQVETTHETHFLEAAAAHNDEVEDAHTAHSVALLHSETAHELGFQEAIATHKTELLQVVATQEATVRDVEAALLEVKAIHLAAVQSSEATHQSGLRAAETAHDVALLEMRMAHDEELAQREAAHEAALRDVQAALRAAEEERGAWELAAAKAGADREAVAESAEAEARRLRARVTELLTEAAALESKCSAAAREAISAAEASGTEAAELRIALDHAKAALSEIQKELATTLQVLEQQTNNAITRTHELAAATASRDAALSQLQTLLQTVEAGTREREELRNSLEREREDAARCLREAIAEHEAAAVVMVARQQEAEREEMMHAAELLAADLERASARIAALETERDQATASLELVSREFGELKETLRVLKQIEVEKSAELARLQVELDRTRRDLERNHATTEQQITALKYQLSSQQLECEVALEGYRTQHAEVLQLSDVLSRQEQLINALESELQSVKEEKSFEHDLHMQQVCADLEKERQSRRKAQDELVNTKLSCGERIAANENELHKLRDENADLRKKLVKLIRDKDNLWQKTDALVYRQKQKAEVKWMDDGSIVQCIGCRARFSLTLRKHHCRLCGRIFCYNCSDNWVMTASSSRKARACDSCFADHNPDGSLNSSLLENSSLTNGAADDDQGSDDEGGGDRRTGTDRPWADRGIVSGASATLTQRADGTPLSPRDASISRHSSADIGEIASRDQLITQSPSLSSQGSSTPVGFSSATWEQEDQIVSSPVSGSSLTLDNQHAVLGERVSLPAGGSVRVPIPIETPETTLFWEFSSEPKGVSFSVTYAPSQAVSSQDVLIPKSKCSSHRQPVKGHLIAHLTGVYLFTFDNTGSRSSDKTVTYAFRQSNL